MSAYGPVGVVTGLMAEARSLEGADNGVTPIVYCAGSSAARAREGAKRLAVSGIGGLLSFGVAGGLDAKLEPGTLVLAQDVVAPDGTRYETSRSWREQVLAEAFGACAFETGAIAGVEAPVLTAASKKSMFAATGAVAADMESLAVAEAAREARLPFLAVRAIADPADRDVPGWALSGVRPDGRTRPFKVMARFLIRPWELPALIALARDAEAAFDALRRVADLRALLAAPG